MGASPHGLLRASKESTRKAPSSRRNFLGGSSFERQSAGHLSSSQRGKDGQLTATEQLWVGWCQTRRNAGRLLITVMQVWTQVDQKPKLSRVVVGFR
jgi:hypothetical protein